MKNNSSPENESVGYYDHLQKPEELLDMINLLEQYMMENKDLLISGALDPCLNDQKELQERYAAISASDE